ncbi:ABC transporter ATP-binding protein [Actinomadura parmotrematis]|uniref:ABC transporter ATP-binding protein n=1 Tax=Actinomadura parmotrematis TaxID=2864039 RepID=A0ABS7FUN9_9ACTN|nr:ABC transporter ATP-binding protein [Actinomadura parmotrematis]MBW8484129.1 ABC transporter ATP-binding protein [Actinomadura parmotrematis]
MSAPLLAARDLRVTGPSGVLVAGLDLTVRHGETVAIVGESGSGKSMAVKALSGLLPAGVRASGEIELDGERVDPDGSAPGWRRIRGARVALLLQDPFTSLSPVHRCGEQIGWAVADRRRRADRVAALLAEVGLPADVAGRYPFELSGGMRQRVAIAAGLAAGPDLLIADEPTTALDVTTQREVLDLVAGLQAERRMGLILVTHDLRLARSRADRILVMYAGRLAEAGPAADVLRAPAHPYTARLAACDPPLGRRLATLPTIPGSVPQPFTVGDACPFAARCELAVDACRTAAPPAVEVAPGHLSACIRTAETTVPTPEPAAPAGAAAVAGEAALTVRGIAKRFRGTAALDGVDLDVGRGEAVAVVGESGSGKTTLARCVVGLETPDAGTVDVGGAPAGPRRVQIVFQDPYSALNPGMTVGASLAEALRAAGRPRSEVPELLDMVGLPAGYARRRPRALSGGERQRVAIARALAPRAGVLVCDEPVSALDVSVQAGVLNLLAGLRRDLGLTLLFITHDLAIARQVADRVYVMRRGAVVESGPAAGVLSAPSHPYTRRLLASLPAAD